MILILRYNYSSRILFKRCVSKYLVGFYLKQAVLTAFYSMD